MESQPSFDMINPDFGDLNSININTQDIEDLMGIGAPLNTHTLSDIENILGGLDQPAAPGNANAVAEQQQHQQQQQPQSPVHLNLFPNLECVQTDYEFDIHIDQGDKLNWLYSAKQEKVYIKLNSMMHLTVSYVPQVANEELWVRAMIVFSRRDEMHLPVTRCPNHRMHKNEVPAFHILKCCNPGTEYHGQENQSWFGQRSSLLVPMGPHATIVTEDGHCQQSLGLEFLCQNSCSNGIQRKQTVLVFTLENRHKQILGKRVMHFKVCSCPKRDMSKELNTAPAPRKRTAAGAPSSAGGKQPPAKMACTNDGVMQVKSEQLSQQTLQQQPDHEMFTDTGATDANMQALSAGIDSFQLDSRTPETLPMASPPTTDTNSSPPTSGSIGSSGSVTPQFPAVVGGGGGGINMNIVMPTRESAEHVLRCAYNEVTGSMTRDRTNTMQYIPYARQLEQLAAEKNMQLW